MGKCYSGLIRSCNGSGYDVIISLTIRNSYNLGEVLGSGIIDKQGYTCSKSELNIENCYNAGKSKKAIIGEILRRTQTETITNIKNTYYDETKSNSIGATEEGITQVNIQNNSEFVNLLNSNIAGDSTLKKWKLGEDGYPTFEN